MGNYPVGLSRCRRQYGGAEGGVIRGEANMPIDSSEQAYEEIEIPSGQVRATYIPEGWAGSPSVRIQIRDDAGHLRQGPEVPIAAIGGMVDAVVKLLASPHSA